MNKDKIYEILSASMPDGVTWIDREELSSILEKFTKEEMISFNNAIGKIIQNFKDEMQEM